MPATAPRPGPAAQHGLGRLGARIRDHRKALKISAQAAAEAAGLSRVTLHRIEQGEASVTMGAYLNVLAALGLELSVAAPSSGLQSATLPEAIRLADHAQLRQIAWSLPGVETLTPQEAFALYERNWRHVDVQALTAQERALIDTLAERFGQGRLLV
jgi:transcriptional regulator with XRE-family HTH domain